MNRTACAPSTAPLSPMICPPARNTRLPSPPARIRATSVELVTTVSRLCDASARARKLVVVPVSIITVSPWRIVAATARAMACLAPAFSRIRRRNGASPACPDRLIAPCIRRIEPPSTKGRTSRRTVSALTPIACDSAAIVTVPSVSSNRRISVWRLDSMAGLFAVLWSFCGLCPSIRSNSGMKNTKNHKSQLTQRKGAALLDG